MERHSFFVDIPHSVISNDPFIGIFKTANRLWLITGEKKYAINEVLNKVSEPTNEPDYKAKYHQCTENYMKLNQEVIALRYENKHLKEKKQ